MIGRGYRWREVLPSFAIDSRVSERCPIRPQSKPDRWRSGQVRPRRSRPDSTAVLAIGAIAPKKNISDDGSQVHMERGLAVVCHRLPGVGALSGTSAIKTRPVAYRPRASETLQTRFPRLSCHRCNGAQ